MEIARQDSVDQLERFRSLFEHIDDAILDCTPEGTIVGWNPGAERLLGYSAEEAIGRSIMFLVPLDRQGELESALQILREGGRIEPIETERIRKDGSRIQVSVRPSRIDDRDGTLVGFSGILRDVTERKQVEEALRREVAEREKTEQALRRYQAMIDSAGEAILGIDPDGLIHSWNPGAERIYGYSAQEMVGRNVSHLAPPSKQAEVDEIRARILSGQPARNLETVRQHKDGRLVEISLTVSPVFDELGRVVGNTSLAIDIGARQEAERRWRSVVENAPDIILVADRQHRIRFINKTEHGEPPEALIGMDIFAYIPPEHQDMVRQKVESVFRTGQPVSYETRAVDLEGRQLGWYASRVGPVKRGAEIDAVIMIATNITERKNAERELKRSRSKLRSLSARLQSAQEKERLRIARELHDELGQVLTALKIDLAWLEDRTEEGAQLDRIAAMARLVDTTIGTVRRIATSLRPQLLDDLGPSAAIDWLTQEVCSRSGLHYRFRSNLGEERFEGERGLALFRICQEALTNIVRHAGATRVEVELERQGSQVTLRITDDGRGISEEQATGSESLGLLGLQERVLMLDGSVEIEGWADRGSRITARFPFNPSDTSGAEGFRA